MRVEERRGVEAGEGVAFQGKAGLAPGQVVVGGVEPGHLCVRTSLPGLRVKRWGAARRRAWAAALGAARAWATVTLLRGHRLTTSSTERTGPGLYPGAIRVQTGPGRCQFPSWATTLAWARSSLWEARTSAS